MSRKAFEEWCALISDCDYREGAWDAWQYREAQHEKELAALHARVKELEEALLNQLYPSILGIPTLAEANSQARAALSTTSPNQALQRALLDAKIDEIEASYEEGYRQSVRIKYLRAKRAELGE